MAIYFQLPGIVARVQLLAGILVGRGIVKCTIHGLHSLRIISIKRNYALFVAAQANITKPNATVVLAKDG